MSQRQLALRAAALLTATAGALAPIADLVAKRRTKRRDNDDDDNGKRRQRDNDDDDKRRRRDDDDDDGGDNRLRSSKQSQAPDDGDNRLDRTAGSTKRNKRSDDDGDDEAGPAGTDRISVVRSEQSVVGDLDIQGIIADRFDDVLAGGGGGNDDPNILVSEDGDSLVVLTNDIEFAGDEFGFEVETNGISYSSGGGDIDPDFDS